MQNNTSRNGSEVIYESLDQEKFHEYVSPTDFGHLKRVLAASRNAKPGVPAIKLYGKDTDDIATNFYSGMQAKNYKFFPEQFKYEMSRLTKWGDQGGRAAFAEIKPEVELYVTNPVQCQVDSIPEESMAKYQKLHLKERSSRDTLLKQKESGRIKRTANSWRRFSLKKNTQEAEDDAVFVSNSLDMIKKSYAYQQTYKRKQKNRIFIPIGFGINLAQAKFHDPLLEAIQNDLRARGAESEFTMFADKIGFDKLFNIMSAKSQGLEKWRIIKVTQDFFHMDTTYGEDQKKKHYIPKLAAAFDIKPGSQAYKKLEDIICQSNRTPIATPDGVITNIIKGEGSGATVTNQGECCGNEDYQVDTLKEIISKLKGVLGIIVIIIDRYVNGDDGYFRLLVTNPELTVEKLRSLKQSISDIIDSCAEHQCDLYGFIKNEKWHIGFDCDDEPGYYCQYELYEDNDCNVIPIYPETLIFNSIVHPMHEHAKSEWDSDFTDWRISQSTDHAYGQANFTDLVDYVDNGLKYGLFGHTIDDFKRIFSKYEKYRALQDTEQDYNVVDQEWLDKPYKSPTIKYIAHKRGISDRELYQLYKLIAKRASKVTPVMLSPEEESLEPEE
jgi:hypothetical protein